MNSHNYLNYDNPHLPTSLRLYMYIRDTFPYVGLAFIGFVLVSASYGIFYYYKDILIAYARKDEEGQRPFYYTYVEHKSYIKYIIYFNIILTGFWISALVTQWRYYLVLSGITLFVILYVVVLAKHYLWDKNPFDYFDEFVWLYDYLATRLRKDDSGKLKSD